MELYHVMNRGVEKRDLFIEEIDYVRFVHNLYEFNDSSPANNNSGYHMQYRDFVSPYILRDRKPVVDIHGWVLMRNHYHLLLSEKVEGGITTFLRKLNIGYAKYFNEKYTRSGALFQGRTKKVHIASQAHFLYILHYIHLNPLDYLSGSEGWRMRNKENIKSSLASLEYLDSYRWSSYLDYCKDRNFPSILTFSLFESIFSDYRQEVSSYLQDRTKDESSMSKEITLE